MPANPTLQLKLQAANPLNAGLTWESPEICEGPASFAQLLTRLLFVDAGDFAKIVGVIRSDGKPSSADTNKIWAKTSAPYGIGVYAGGRWQVSYQHPQNSPFLWDTSVTSVPTYISAMTASAVTGAGLTAPTDAKWKWVIFNPPT